jgi:hypothetical protein
MRETDLHVVRIIDCERKVAPGLVSTPMRLPGVEKKEFDADRIM